MSTATPGPWHKEAYEGHDIVDVYDADGFRVASCHYYAPHQDRRAFSTCDEHTEREDGVCQANARLIAAAPALYEYVASSASAGCATAAALIATLIAEERGA